MSEADQDEKTEDPSGKRLSEARGKGNVAVSQEVKNAFGLAGTLLVTAVALPMMGKYLMEHLRVYLAAPASFAPDGASIGFALLQTFGQVALIMAFPVAALMAIGLASNWLQTGFLWSSEAFKFDFNRINPLTGFKKLFSTRSLIELAKNIAKLGLLGFISYIYIQPVIEHNAHFASLSLPDLMKETHTLAKKLITAVVVAVSAIAVLDYFYQRFSYIKKLRMTKQEVKDEFKQSEGDPKIKSKIRGMRQQKARQRMMAMVPKSDVVITNPTHFAIALEYKPDMMQAPIVRAKGADLIAKRIRELADEHKIPRVENAPLARALYSACEIDQEIPADQYKAVAEVISYVFKLRGRKMKPAPSKV